MDRDLTGWRTLDPATLDREYNARATVPDVAPFLAEYRARTDAAKAALPWQTLRYGAHERERIEFYPAAGGAPAPLLLFIHGGYWRLLDAADSGFMAPAFTATGVAVAALDYVLAPAATLDAIVAQCRAGLSWLTDHADTLGIDAARIHVAGSSAGGHLAAMLCVGDAPGVAGATLLSGLYDLEPLRHCAPQEWLRLDAAAVARLSPLRLAPPRRGLPIVTTVADTESRQFKRQTEAYTAFAAARPVAPPAGSNHFDVVCELCDVGTPLARATLAAIRG